MPSKINEGLQNCKPNGPDGPCHYLLISVSYREHRGNKVCPRKKKDKVLRFLMQQAQMALDPTSWLISSPDPRNINIKFMMKHWLTDTHSGHPQIFLKYYCVLHV